jgi:general secretion pathway protein G
MTLLELMLVMALISLLAAIAIPSYQGYANRARVNRAISEIAMLSLELSKWQLNVGTLPATLAEAGLDGRLDPWGQAYVYLNHEGVPTGEYRKDKNLNPVNTDYDLYSIGRDGSTVKAFTGMPARDDIVRCNNGGFIGLAEDY